jgi:hypothetical protein
MIRRWWNAFLDFIYDHMYGGYARRYWPRRKP